MPPDAEITEDRLTELVERFYGRVREDALIAPVFNRAIGDWPHHLEQPSHVCSSVMLTTGRYTGNPVAHHLTHLANNTPELFDSLLTLRRETNADLVPPEDAFKLQANANRFPVRLQHPQKSTP